MSKEQLSPYRVSWVMLFPVRLSATKADAKALGCERPNNQMLWKPFCDAEQAREWVYNHMRYYHITKPYRAYIISDAQFAMLPEVSKAGFMEVVTKRQLMNVMILN